MNTFIKVKLQIEGVHRWPDAIDFAPKVGFLQWPHRHIFHITITKKVTHDDRDIEIILFKREVEDFLKRNYFSETMQTIDFRSMSCEMIAKELLEVYDCDCVEVLEDNENGGLCIKL